MPRSARLTAPSRASQGHPASLAAMAEMDRMAQRVIEVRGRGCRCGKHHLTNTKSRKKKKKSGEKHTDGGKLVQQKPLYTRPFEVLSGTGDAQGQQGMGRQQHHEENTVRDPGMEGVHGQRARGAMPAWWAGVSTHPLPSTGPCGFLHSIPSAHPRGSAVTTTPLPPAF